MLYTLVVVSLLGLHTVMRFYAAKMPSSTRAATAEELVKLRSSIHEL